MPLTLDGSCRCGAIRFRCESHAPVPFQLCYCGICRKTAGGGGYAINLSAEAQTLTLGDSGVRGVYRARIEDDGHCVVSTGQRHFCKLCASALWLHDPTWSDLIHPFASAIDTPLPVASQRRHIMLRFKPAWVPLAAGPGDVLVDLCPDESIATWHRERGLWVA